MKYITNESLSDKQFDKLINHFNSNPFHLIQMKKEPHAYHIQKGVKYTLTEWRKVTDAPGMINNN